MNKIIFTLIGIIVGGVVSGVFVGTNCAKTYKKKINELTEENNQLYSELHARKREDIRKREEKVREAEAEVDNSLEMQLVQAREEKRKTAEMVKEHGYFVAEDEEDDYDVDEDVEFDDPFDEGESVVVKKPVEKKTPAFSVMSQEDFERDLGYHGNIEYLTYYQEDDVLEDDVHDRIGNAVAVVGEEALKKAKETDDDYLYVLDEVEDVMYEIEINHEDSYYRDIVRGGVV